MKEPPPPGEAPPVKRRRLWGRAGPSALSAKGLTSGLAHLEGAWLRSVQASGMPPEIQPSLRLPPCAVESMPELTAMRHVPTSLTLASKSKVKGACLRVRSGTHCRPWSQASHRHGDSSTCACVFVHVRGRVHAWVFVYMHVCVRVYMHVCVHTRLCVPDCVYRRESHCEEAPMSQALILLRERRYLSGWRRELAGLRLFLPPC